MQAEINQIIKLLEQAELSVGEGAAPAITAEWRMRLLAEQCTAVEEEIQKITKGKKDYLSCSLSQLTRSVIKAFNNNLNSDEIEVLRKFGDCKAGTPRNKGFHGELSTMLNLLGIYGTSRNISRSPTGMHRGEIKKDDTVMYKGKTMNVFMLECIKSVTKDNHGFGELRKQCNIVNQILDKLLRSLWK